MDLRATHDQGLTVLTSKPKDVAGDVVMYALVIGPPAIGFWLGGFSGALVGVAAILPVMLAGYVIGVAVTGKV